MRIPDEIKTRYPKALFVYRIIIQRIILHNACHTNHGVMALQLIAAAQVEYIVSWRNNYFVPV